MKKANPFLLAAVVVAACVYSSSVPVCGGAAYASLVPLGATRSVDCRLSSSPSKSSGLSGTAYRCSARVFRSSGDYGPGTAVSAAAGTLVLSLPPALVESLYPGRLYSRASGALLMESGAAFRLTGAWNQARGVFEVSGATALGWGKGPVAACRRFRAVARLRFSRMVYAWGAAGGLVLALLSGSRDYLDPSLVESFRRAGLSHILALSGMHLSFFSSVAGISASRLFGRGHGFLPRLLAVCLFVFFAGLSPSLFRAFLCTLLLSLCSRCYVSGVDGGAVLGAVFLLHALLRREDLLAPAFMLSYAAVAGILLLAPPCERRLAPFLPPAVAAPLSTSLAAFAATAPLSLGIFGYAAPVGIVAGMAVSPLVSLFLLASLAAVCLCLLCPGLSPLCASLLDALYSLIGRMAAFFALCPPVGLG